MDTYSKHKSKIESMESKCKPVVLLSEDDWLKRHFVTSLSYDLAEQDVKFEYLRYNLEDMDMEHFRNLVTVQSLISKTKVIHIKCDAKDLNKKFTIKKPKPRGMTYEEIFLDVIDTAKQKVYLILDFATLDKRKKLYKKISKMGMLIEIKPLGDKDLIKFCSNFAKDNKSSLSTGLAKHFLELVEHDMNLIISELGKLCNYTDKISQDDIDLLIKKSIKVAVFDLIECVSKGETKQSVLILDEFIGQGNSPFQILTLLATQYERLFYAKVYGNMKDGELAKVMGCPPFFIKKIKEQAEKLSMARIHSGIDAITETEVSLKTGYNQEQSLNLLILKLARSVKRNVRKNTRTRTK